jgi:hypothetical protein
MKIQTQQEFLHCNINTAVTPHEHAAAMATGQMVLA